MRGDLSTVGHCLELANPVQIFFDGCEDKKRFSSRVVVSFTVVFRYTKVTRKAAKIQNNQLPSKLEWNQYEILSFNRFVPGFRVPRHLPPAIFTLKIGWCSKPELFNLFMLLPHLIKQILCALLCQRHSTIYISQDFSKRNLHPCIRGN